jgi:DNA-binding CsgD family transcriptional regulator
MDLRAIDPTDVGSGFRHLWAAAAVFGLVAALAALDLAADLREGTTLRHALVEGAIALTGTVGLVWLLARFAVLRRRAREARATVDGLAADLARSRAEAATWKSEAGDLLAGLGVLIDRQFGRWGLTPAEREVALLLLKGLSHKEVAAARGVGEATVRQQATALYRKAGVSGRHDLAAFFLEDLLAPRQVD